MTYSDILNLEGRRTIIDFLVMKFSEWLDNSHIDHTVVHVKGGYIIQFNNPDSKLKELISSLFVTVDSGEFGSDGMSIKKSLNIFTSSGDAIVVDEKYYADILNAIQPVLYEYVRKRSYN